MTLRLIRGFVSLRRGGLRGVAFREAKAIRFLQPGREIHLRRGIVLIHVGSRIMEKRAFAPFWN